MNFVTPYADSPQAARNAKGQFARGRSGNPAGRPRGSRNQLAQSFYQALADDFEQHGVAAIEALRTANPGAYLRICAAVALKEPQEPPTTQEAHNPLATLTVAELEEIIAVLESNASAQENP